MNDGPGQSCLRAANSVGCAHAQVLWPGRHRVVHLLRHFPVHMPPSLNRTALNVLQRSGSVLFMAPSILFLLMCPLQTPVLSFSL